MHNPVHFTLYIVDVCARFQLLNLIPRGSAAHPGNVKGSAFMFNYWYDVGYSSSVEHSRVNLI